MFRIHLEPLSQPRNHLIFRPSFRDQEVVWENVRVLKDGETVSTSGTHLGHNIPSKDRRNRYCINLLSIAGEPPEDYELDSKNEALNL